RQRLEDWFAHHGEMPDRIVEITSYHAMLGCVVAGMGISLMPRSVLTTFPDAKLLSVHSLPPALAHAPISLIPRKGTLAPKGSAAGERGARGSAGAHRHGQKPARDAPQRAGRSRPRQRPFPRVGRAQASCHDSSAAATRSPWAGRQIV